MGISAMKRVLIRCGWLVTLDAKLGDFRSGEILLTGNRIEAIGRNLGAKADETIDASDKIVMPGLVNAHMHTWETVSCAASAPNGSPLTISRTCTATWRPATTPRTTTSPI